MGLPDSNLDGGLESGKSAAILERIKTDLLHQLHAFDREFTRALKRIYREHPSTRTSDSSMGEGGRAPGLDVTPNEDVLELFFFCFVLQELCTELMHLVELCVIIRSREDQLELKNRQRRERYGRLAPLVVSTSHLRASYRRLIEIAKRFATLLPTQASSSPFPPSVDIALSSHWSQRQRLSFFQRISRSFWRASRSLTRKDIRFALKTGIGAGLLCAPAFIPATRPTWVLYRGEWALISYMVVVATTVGQSNFNTIMRIVGTILGALVAVGSYHLLHSYPVLLALFGWAFSLPCFWLVVTKPKYATTGRFLLLAYNLTALYSYNMREQDLHITLVAFRRSIAVVIGSVWAWVISTMVWRYEARRELRAGLSELMLNVAWLYEKLVRAYSTPPVELTRTPSRADVADADEHTSLLTPAGRRRLNDTINEFVEMELHLQRQLIALNGLLASCQHEPRLKGPFPVRIYRDVLSACQIILDTIHSMRVVTTREAWYTTVRQNFVIPVQKERREMVGCILLYLGLLASAVSLKSPLPPYLPPAEQARQRLMDAIRELPVVKRRAIRRPTDLLYYAYSATLADICEQLDFLGDTFKDLYGVIGGRTTEDWEEMFVWEEGEEGGDDNDDGASTPDDED